jgi:hypothetical protein
MVHVCKDRFLDLLFGVCVERLLEEVSLPLQGDTLIHGETWPEAAICKVNLRLFSAFFHLRNLSFFDCRGRWQCTAMDHLAVGVPFKFGS